MATQAFRDKQEFFDNLYSLDFLAREDDESDRRDAANRGARSLSQRSPRSFGGHIDGSGRQIHAGLDTEVTEKQLTRTSAGNTLSISKDRSLLAVTPRLDASKSISTSGDAPILNPPSKRRIQTEDAAPKMSKKVRKKGPEVPQIFEGQTFFFVPNNDRAVPRKRRIDKAVLYGANWARAWTGAVTYIIVEDGRQMADVRKAVGRDIPAGVHLVLDRWLSDCLSFKELRDTKPRRFQVPGAEQLSDPTISAPVSHASTHPLIAAGVDKLEEETNLDIQRKMPRDALTDLLEEVKKSKQLPINLEDDESPYPSFASAGTDSSEEARTINSGFQCMSKNDGMATDTNPNSATINLLQDMASYYDRMSDHWHTLAYRRAITTLHKQSNRIETKEQALALPHIGERLAEKIVEIASTNRLQRLEAAMADNRDRTMQLFMGIYGVGPSVASKWISQGLSTLEDIKTKGDMTPAQRIGLEHYDDFLAKIPRAEVAEHARIVQEALRLFDPNLQLIVGGSYRRGKSESGDIDCLITKQGASIEHVRSLVMGSVVPHLESTGFLKASLAASHSRDDGSKWHGASALPGAKIWRRIDLLFVPWDELGAALIYFTGNDIFNRSIRLLASKHGMRLNQHGLYKNVMRGSKRQKLTDGTLVESQSEKEIFDALGVPWRPPEHRNC